MRIRTNLSGLLWFLFLASLTAFPGMLQGSPQVGGGAEGSAAAPARRRSPEADSALLQRARRQLRQFPGVAFDVANGVITVQAGTLRPAEHERLFQLARTIPGARGVIVRFRAPG